MLSQGGVGLVKSGCAGEDDADEQGKAAKRPLCKCEHAVIKAPLEAFNACEWDAHSSAHQSATCASGVMLVPPEQYEAIMGHKPDFPQGWLTTDQVPLFFGESKSAETWKALISSLQVSCCFDLTAGTSTLAEVCIEEDVKYLGVAGSD